MGGLTQHSVLCQTRIVLETFGRREQMKVRELGCSDKGFKYHWDSQDPVRYYFVFLTIRAPSNYCQTYVENWCRENYSRPFIFDANGNATGWRCEFAGVIRRTKRREWRIALCYATDDWDGPRWWPDMGLA